ncbi:olfactory receptor 2T11-like [Alligator mississippiensis]|uniref:olfactory receptor 2T11-like n=1 Tax=Alligator mississippiensis TaxID=8496 RepID=UPI00287725D1|nr:olfactory receptor 2T11-like [Alligator mississippiensis]
MKSGNDTSSADFFLLGFLSWTNVHMFSLAIIVLAFIAALSGNALLIFLIQVDSSLHTPMYFFLSQLAFMDICQTLIVVPKMVADFLTPGNPISPAGCGAQVSLTLTMGRAECLLLAVMAYDRYIAICNLLQYPILLSRRVCLGLTSSVWVGASADALILTTCAMHLPYCGSKEINYFFCEVPVLLKLSCSDTSQYETLLFVCGNFLLLIPSSTILASYSHILAAVLSMKSTRGQQKALATCSSHLTVVGMFYGAAIFTYMRPSSYHFPEQVKIVSLFYTIVTPVLNPLIYSLRNKDFLAALRNLFGKGRIFQQN